MATPKTATTPPPPNPSPPPRPPSQERDLQWTCDFRPLFGREAHFFLAGNGERQGTITNVLLHSFSYRGPAGTRECSVPTRFVLHDGDGDVIPCAQIQKVVVRGEKPPAWAISLSPIIGKPLIITTFPDSDHPVSIERVEYAGFDFWLHGAKGRIEWPVLFHLKDREGDPIATQVIRSMRQDIKIAVPAKEAPHVP